MKLRGVQIQSVQLAGHYTHMVFIIITESEEIQRFHFEQVLSLPLNASTEYCSGYQSSMALFLTFLGINMRIFTFQASLGFS